MPLPYNFDQVWWPWKTTRKRVICYQKLTRNSKNLKSDFFCKSHQKSTGSHARVMKTCTHHILDKINLKTLWGGTSGQTGNSWFFDFWGEYLENFGGNSNFFPYQKVVHHWFPTKSLITADPQKPLLPPLWIYSQFPEVKKHHFRKSKITQTNLNSTILTSSPTLVLSGVALSCFAYEI